MENKKVVIIKAIDEMIEKVNAEEVEFNGGESLVVRSYINTKRYLNSDVIVIDSIVWERDLQDFLNALRKLNVNQIIVADTSTALMGLIHFLLTEGCTIEKAVTVDDYQPFAQDKKGLLVKIN